MDKPTRVIITDPYAAQKFISRIRRPKSKCEWFALCENEATTTRSHPILGDVPICDRCDKKVEALS